MTYEAKMNGMWHGMVPPQYVYAHRRFKAVAVNPPNTEGGSWCGAGKASYDPQNKQFLLSSRPRKAEGNVRGFAAEIYTSPNGEDFELAGVLTKEEVVEKSGLRVHSIEGTQLLQDPFTDQWHLYLSVDTGEDFAWGGVYWETLLFTAPLLTGPWDSQGFVLRRDQSYDHDQARDSSIDIIDGTWYCLYKAVNADRIEHPALATSLDGINWTKHGIFTIDGEDHPVFLSGSLFAGTSGPIFMGTAKSLSGSRETQEDVVYYDDYKIGHGGGDPADFAAFRMDQNAMNLETIFRHPWEPGSEYEHPKHPLLGYSTSVYDPLKHRILFYIEAIDPRYTTKVGLNETVERILVYETVL